MSGTDGEGCHYTWRWDKEGDRVEVEASIRNYNTKKWYGMAIQPARVILKYILQSITPTFKLEYSF